MKKIITLLLILFAISNFVFSQDTNEQKLKQLEVKIEQQEENIQLFNKRVEIAESGFEIKLEGYKLELQKEISYSWISLIFALIVGAGGVFGILKFTNEKVRAEVLKQVTEVVSINREDLLSVIHQNEYIEELKRTKKIVVLSAKKTSDNELQKFFSYPKNGFKNAINYLYASKEEDDNKSLFDEIAKYDLVLLNNELDDFKDYADFVKPEGNTFYLYYNTTNSRAKVKSTKRFNFANSPTTLYDNIIATLKAQDILAS